MIFGAGKNPSKLYLSGIEMQVVVGLKASKGVSKLYLSGIEIAHRASLVYPRVSLQIVP